MAGHGHTPGYIIPLQINGEEVRTKISYKVVNPATGKVAWKSSSASKSDAIRAAEVAQAASPAWAKLKVSERRDIFLKAADILAARAEELSEFVRIETGAAEPWAAFNISGSIEQLRDVAGRISNVVGQVPPYDQDGRSAMVLKEPYGVVLGIAPWNAPYYLGFRAITYALAAGNTTILKGSELSPRCFSAIGYIFKEAGLPDGVLNVITVRHEDAAEVTNTLIEHAAVKKINFTGSSAVGSIIAATAGRNLKPVLLELGGKASAIVLEDADVQLAASECALGAFYHSGQICMGTERILVHSSIAQSFANALKIATAHIFPQKAPASILITPSGVLKNRTLITQALSQGASLLTGNIDDAEASDTRLRPFILENVTPDMDIYYEESFGPTVSLLTFQTEDEAIFIANDTEYGLSASVFTTDLAAGFRVAKQIDSGAVHINLMTVHDDFNLPHGGVKRSGFGRFNANFGLEEFLRLKTITWAD